MAVNIH